VSTTRNWGRVIITPFGEARANDKGLVLWAEWEVWRHAAQLVEEGLWTSRESSFRNRQRTQFYVGDATTA
jgi:hypothetical protein